VLETLAVSSAERAAGPLLGLWSNATRGAVGNHLKSDSASLEEAANLNMLDRIHAVRTGDG